MIYKNDSSTFFQTFGAIIWVVPLPSSGVTYDSGSLATSRGSLTTRKLGHLYLTGFFKGNTFRVKIGANSPALGGDTGTWGLGVGLGDNLYEIWGQLFWFWGLAQGDLRFWGGTWLGTTFMGLGEHIFGFGGWGQGESLGKTSSLKVSSQL